MTGGDLRCLRMALPGRVFVGDAARLVGVTLREWHAAEDSREDGERCARLWERLRAAVTGEEGRT